MSQARRNASDGISLVQTAEGGLKEAGNILTRLRELSVQAASDTLGEQEREFLDKEFLALKDEIDRIAMSTKFNDLRPLIGDRDLGDELNNQEGTFPLELQVGKDYYTDADSLDQDNPVNTIKVDLASLNSLTDGANSLGIGKAEDGTRVISKQQAQDSISKLGVALDKVNEQRAYLGSIQNRLNSTVTNLGIQIENLSEAQSRILDTDFAAETARYTSQNILQQAGTSILAQGISYLRLR